MLEASHEQKIHLVPSTMTTSHFITTEIGPLWPPVIYCPYHADSSRQELLQGYCDTIWFWGLASSISVLQWYIIALLPRVFLTATEGVSIAVIGPWGHLFCLNSCWHLSRSSQPSSVFSRLSKVRLMASSCFCVHIWLTIVPPCGYDGWIKIYSCIF